MTFVRSQTEHGVATLVLDNPATRNALSTAVIEELLAALAAAEADDAVRVVVLSHAGPVFCSGADLRETADAFDSGRPPVSRLGELLAAIWEGRKPVVARVGGPARAGGLGLIAAADIAVCTADATFAFSEVRIGVIPAVISATVLPRLAPRDAAELFLTGATFDGARAERIGLVTAAVEPASLDAAVAGYVVELLRAAPGALAGAKALLRHRRADTFGAEIAALTELSVGYFGSAEGREGIMAFREKRRPSWIPDGAV
ncbi:enoyl-CoA hydratase-related protein [Dactylosporangium sp. CA-092794]|uniref:enoyl-CoA hydratase-related protein n=1 Tax=Dactylosporangium sp. CA-092794 TaxID=3239929 RepID=UPI003D8B0FE4